MKNQNKKVVIIGGGFGGVACANFLLQNSPNLDIALIDKNLKHVIHGNLYSVVSVASGTAPQQIIDEQVEIDLLKIFANKRIGLLKSEAGLINLEKHEVEAGRQKLHYDFLVCTTGSVPEYFNIDGAKDYSLPFASGIDSLRLRNDLEFLFQSKRHEAKNKTINLVVAGGGATGCELAAELAIASKNLAAQNFVDPNNISVTIIDAAPKILSNFDSKISKLAEQRLRILGVNIKTDFIVSRVEKNLIHCANNMSLNFDILIWTAGMRATYPNFSRPVLQAKGMRIEVSESLALGNFPNVFVLGDAACVHDSCGGVVPQSAVCAIEQGRHTAKNILRVLNNVRPENFSASRCYEYFLPLGGKWAISQSKSGKVYSGKYAFWRRQIFWLKYFISILPLSQALKLSLQNNEIFSSVSSRDF